MTLLREIAIVFGLLFGSAGLAAMAVLIALLCMGQSNVR